MTESDQSAEKKRTPHSHAKRRRVTASMPLQLEADATHVACKRMDRIKCVSVRCEIGSQQAAPIYFQDLGQTNRGPVREASPRVVAMSRAIESVIVSRTVRTHPGMFARGRGFFTVRSLCGEDAVSRPPAKGIRRSAPQ
jgi:hypothetical protein